MVIDNDGSDPVIGSFAGLPHGASVSSSPLFISYIGGDGNDIVLTRVPPPALPPSPSLTIEILSADSVRLLWPTNSPPATLQSSTNLVASNWLAVAPAAVVVGTNHVVTNSIQGEQKFYRLSVP